MHKSVDFSGEHIHHLYQTIIEGLWITDLETKLFCNNCIIFRLSCLSKQKHLKLRLHVIHIPEYSYSPQHKRRRNSVNIGELIWEKGNGHLLSIQGLHIFLWWFWIGLMSFMAGVGSKSLSQGSARATGILAYRRGWKRSAWVPFLPFSSEGSEAVTSIPKMERVGLGNFCDPFQLSVYDLSLSYFISSLPSHIWTELAKPVDLERKTKSQLSPM